MVIAVGIGGLLVSLMCIFGDKKAGLSPPIFYQEKVTGGTVEFEHTIRKDLEPGDTPPLALLDGPKPQAIADKLSGIAKTSDHPQAIADKPRPQAKPQPLAIADKHSGMEKAKPQPLAIADEPSGLIAHLFSATLANRSTRSQPLAEAKPQPLAIAEKPSGILHQPMKAIETAPPIVNSSQQEVYPSKLASTAPSHFQRFQVEVYPSKSRALPQQRSIELPPVNLGKPSQSPTAANSPVRPAPVRLSSFPSHSPAAANSPVRSSSAKSKRSTVYPEEVIGG